MIGYLHGVLHEVRDDGIILDVQGVGYEIHLTKVTTAQLPALGSSLALTIVTIVREDAITLYGFGSLPDKQIFNILLSVSGIGPKQAINILSNATTEQLSRAILDMDVDFLESIRGIGRKTAEKIILETKDRLVKLSRLNPANSAALLGNANTVRSDLMAALLQLGYRRHEISNMLERLNLNETSTLQQSIKESLRILATQPTTGV